MQMEYNGRMWSGNVKLNENSKEYTTFTLTPEDSVDGPSAREERNDETKSVELVMRVQEMGSWKLTLYCPYWIVNKTGLVLEYAVRVYTNIKLCIYRGVYMCVCMHPRVFCAMECPILYISCWAQKQ